MLHENLEVQSRKRVALMLPGIKVALVKIFMDLLVGDCHDKREEEAMFPWYYADAMKGRVRQSANASATARTGKPLARLLLFQFQLLEFMLRL